MLCEVCVWMLRGRRGQKYGATLGLQFVHHDSAESFWASVARDCSICRPIGDEVGAKFISALRTPAMAHDPAFLELRSHADLSAVSPGSDYPASIYRLDFLVEWAGFKFHHTFALRPIIFQENAELPFRTPVSDRMRSPEVLSLASTWIQKCCCVPERILRKEDFPTRLINLNNLKKLWSTWRYRENLDSEEPYVGDTLVNLVDTNDLDWSQLEHKAYVTLSHKWGAAVEPVWLTKGTEKAYRGGVRLGDLSRTFRDAMEFSVCVDDRVQYIWIDSLCIIQDDEQDWLKESDRMQDVYRNSFLNISATAAEHSGEGLYSQRDPQHLWEEVVCLDVEGLRPGEGNTRQKSRVNGSSTTTATTSLGSNSGFTRLARIQSCLLVDISSWEILVNRAPIHKRGWVFQERLLSPRVLHFCRGRIAWECAEFDEIEGQVPGIPNYQLIGGEIDQRISIKGRRPEVHGKRLRDRLDRLVDNPALDQDDRESRIVHSLELWSQIVETYCKTDLTRQKDRLIALSGIAHRMANIIAEGEHIRYVAGLWDVHLVSQLLWRVEPVYRGDKDSSSDTIEYLSRRPKEYRAPSFSWASVDSQLGNGITCGCVLDADGILVEVLQHEDGNGSGLETEVWKQSVSVQSETHNEFGLVKSGHIRLWAWLHPVKLQREGTHYYWSLFSPRSLFDTPWAHDHEKHFNVYLDCPADDDGLSNRLINSGNTYCVPMAYGPSSQSTDIICLLLENAPLDRQTRTWPDAYRRLTFKRIGWTKLSNSFNHSTWEYISNFRPSKKRSDEFYDERTGRYLVCII